MSKAFKVNTFAGGTLCPSWKTWRAEPCSMFPKIWQQEADKSCLCVNKIRLLSTNWHKSSNTFLRIWFCIEQGLLVPQTRDNKAIFFQSYCTTLEDTVRLPHTQCYQCSPLQPPLNDHSWCLNSENLSQAWPLNLYGQFCLCGADFAKNILYLWPELTEDLFSQ